MTDKAYEAEMADFASLMVDETIAAIRIQLVAGEGLAVSDQLAVVDQLIKERKPLAATPTPPTLSEDLQPQHVAAFLTGVRANPGGKNPVESYYTPSYPDDGTHEKPSWKIAEEAGWVTCNGSHKWTLTMTGNEALIRHEYAALAQVKAS